MKTDKTIKMLEDVKKHATDPKFRKEIESKIEKLTNHKPVEK